jgi:hypothetical protein
MNESEDYIKINSDLRTAAVAALIDTASELGLPFTIEDEMFIVALPGEVE